jgi:hypothetical protein
MSGRIANAIGCASTIVLLFGCARPGTIGAFVAGSRVIIDGEFSEWARIAPAATTSAASIRQRSDGHYVYFQLDFPQPTNLLGYDGTLTIAVDADGSEGTGANVDGLSGTDFTIDFSPRAENGRLIEGATVRAWARGGAMRATDTYAFDFVMLPTYSTSRLEMRLARGRQLDSAAAPIFVAATYRASVIVHDPSGSIRVAGQVFSAPLPPLATPVAADQASDPLARAPGTHFRVLVWNVANEGIQQRPDHFRRVIAANDPDVLILDEVGGVIGVEGTKKFLATLESPRSRAPWSFTYGGGGGYQRTVIASRASVSELPELKLVPFPDSMTARWVPQIPAANQEREKNSIRNGVATGGAVVTIGGKRLAAFGVDLQSAGNRSGSWQEARRIAEAKIIRDVASRAIQAHGPLDGVILAGDHNLIGTREALTIHADIGRAFDGRPLHTAEPLQLDRATAATWDGSGGPFPPGRLDWFTFSDATLDVLGSYVFDVGDLNERWRSAHGLQADDSRRSSDHRPLVVDLRWRR